MTSSLPADERRRRAKEQGLAYRLEQSISKDFQRAGLSHIPRFLIDLVNKMVQGKIIFHAQIKEFEERMFSVEI